MKIVSGIRFVCRLPLFRPPAAASFLSCSSLMHIHICVYVCVPAKRGLCDFWQNFNDFQMFSSFVLILLKIFSRHLAMSLNYHLSFL